MSDRQREKDLITGAHELLNPADMGKAQGGEGAVAELCGRIEKAWHNHDGNGRVYISMGDAMILVEQILAQPAKPAAETVVPDGWVLVPCEYIDAVNKASSIASSYSPCIDAVEEHGGDEHEDPCCAIHHILYYASYLPAAAPKGVI